MGHCSAPPAKVCGRSRMYSVSQSTRGSEMVIQRTVRLDAVWHHVDSPTSEGFGGDVAAMVSFAAMRALLAVRRASDFAAGVESRSDTLLVGAGDAVEVREGFLVGEGSYSGKSPRGCWRVATMVAVFAIVGRRSSSGHKSVVVMSQDAAELVGSYISGLALAERLNLKRRSNEHGSQSEN